MSRDKQIKKVSKQRQEYLKFKPFADDLRKAESWCELDGVLNRYQTVKNLHKMGYRKSEEVAREIFEEIAKIIQKYDKVAEKDKSEYGELIVMDIGCAIGELKKKYTQEK